MKDNMLIIDLGNTKGITRKLDKLSRIVIPKEFVNELNFSAESELEIFLLDGGVFIRKKQ